MGLDNQFVVCYNKLLLLLILRSNLLITEFVVAHNQLVNHLSAGFMLFAKTVEEGLYVQRNVNRMGCNV